jgi:superfamily II DNA or RNA helicase
VIERLTPDVVASWLPDAVLDKARLDIAEGRVARPAIRQNDVEAVVADAKRGNVRVRITWGRSGPVALCECGTSSKESPCHHAASVGLLLIGDRAAAVGAEESQSEDDHAGALPAIAERELAVRRERGASDLFRIRCLAGGPIYGSYEVRSPSSRRYEVVIRALDRPHNSCSCPDFETNLLGSCKHVEAVLHRLRKRNRRRFNETASEGPARSYLHLGFFPDPEVCLRLEKRASSAARRLFASRFRADGRPVAPGELLAWWPELAREASRVGIEIPAEVERFVGRMRDADARERERRAIEAEVRSAGREQPGFLAMLYPYQVEGVAFLAARKRALLADEMGLGKTAQAIAAMTRMMRKDGVRRTLIVCPSSLKRQWEREIERFAGLASPRVAVLGGRREERRALYETPPEVLITSYELARTDESDVVSLAPDLLILDEAQKIKNWRTKTADVIKRIPSRFAFVLTGTPLENRLDDLYSLMQVIDPHVFGPLWRFNQEFTELDERGRVTGYKNLDGLRRRVASVMRRRRKEEVLKELPAQIVNRLTVLMTREQASFHEDSARQIGMLLSVLKKRPLTPLEERRLLRSFQRMRMACDAAGLVDKTTHGAPKLNELEGLLEELCVQAGHKVVVFSEWERMLAMAAEVCDSLGVAYVRLHGAVPSDARGRLIDRFFSDPDCKVFLSTDAGGVGLNLQAASHVINLDLPWNPAVLAQRIARVHRIGQPNAVNVILMISEASFEENLELALDAKRALFAAAVGDDTETVEISRSTLASRIETLMGGSFAATTGTRRDEVTAAEDPVLVLRARLGDALERIVRLPNGRLLGVVRGNVMPALEVPALLLSENAAEALTPLGEISPLAQGELIYRAEPKTLSDRAHEGRRARLAIAERKLKAAQALLAAGLRVEALGLLRESLSLGCRAAVERGDPGEDPAALLSAIYGELLPAQAIEPADAHALVQSGELFRAFDGAAISPPEPLVAEIARGARDLLARVRERLATSAGAPTV